VLRSVTCRCTSEMECWLLHQRIGVVHGVVKVRSEDMITLRSDPKFEIPTCTLVHVPYSILDNFIRYGIAYSSIVEMYFSHRDGRARGSSAHSCTSDTPHTHVQEHCKVQSTYI
jgi:hypothetical protein